MLGGTSLVREGFKAYFAQRTILRSYLLIPGALAVALMIAWPQDTVQGVLRGGPATDAFSVVAACFLGFMLYLGGRYGAEDYATDTLGNLREYVALPAVSPGSLVAGKAAFALLHTAFLVALGVPFLLAALGVSGAMPGALSRTLAVIAAAGLAVRMYGLLLLCIFGLRRLLRGAALLIGVGAYLAVTWLVLPAMNPVAALIPSSPRADARITVAASLAAALVMAAGSVAVLAAARRGVRGRDADAG
jgi:hypothetical protein